MKFSYDFPPPPLLEFLTPIHPHPPRSRILSLLLSLHLNLQIFICSALSLSKRGIFFLSLSSPLHPFFPRDFSYFVENHQERFLKGPLYLPSILSLSLSPSFLSLSLHPLAPSLSISLTERTFLSRRLLYRIVFLSKSFPASSPVQHFHCHTLSLSLRISSSLLLFLFRTLISLSHFVGSITVVVLYLSVSVDSTALSSLKLLETRIPESSKTSLSLSLFFQRKEVSLV